MEINITITDQDTIDGLKAVRAEDLLNLFLPEIYIKADKVVIHEISEEDNEKRCSGKKYKMYEDKAKK